MNVFFTADTHMGHTNIIKYCNRPFDSIEEHDQALIDNWNSVVTDRDVVYHLGDFAWLKHERAIVDDLTATKLLNALKGRIHFIWGNHDKEFRRYHKHLLSDKLKKRINFLGDYHELKIDKLKIVLTHYAFRVWNGSHHGSWNLYGHSHGTLSDDPHARAIDVGVDCHNYTPINLDQVQDIMDKKLWKPIDHHGERQESGGVGLSREDYAKKDRFRLYQQFIKEFEK